MPDSSGLGGSRFATHSRSPKVYQADLGSDASKDHQHGKGPGDDFDPAEGGLKRSDSADQDSKGNKLAEEEEDEDMDFEEVDDSVKPSD